jgi:hypothetical protein
MGNSDMAWLITELTTDVHGAMRVVSRRNATWKRSVAVTMGCAERSALAS